MKILDDSSKLLPNNLQSLELLLDWSNLGHLGFKVQNKKWLAEGLK